MGKNWYQSNLLLHDSSGSCYFFCSFILFPHETDTEWWTRLLAFLFYALRALTIPLLTCPSFKGEKKPQETGEEIWEGGSKIYWSGQENVRQKKEKLELRFSPYCIKDGVLRNPCTETPDK